jgi:hypothetical protein
MCSGFSAFSFFQPSLRDFAAIGWITQDFVLCYFRTSLRDCRTVSVLRARRSWVYACIVDGGIGRAAGLKQVLRLREG